jgi:hypothetical protein
MMVEAIILKAEDKDGKRLFTSDDRERLLNKVDSDVVSDIASHILSFKADSFGVEKKNYLKTTNFTTHSILPIG